MSRGDSLRSKAAKPSACEIWRIKATDISAFVIDASVAAKWFLPDEASADADDALARIQRGDLAFAPDIFRWEVENLLLTAERANRIDPTDLDDAMELMRDLPIRLEAGPSRFLAGSELALARAYGLTSYDAAYLVCADSLNLELVTADAALGRAAQNLGLNVTLVQ